MQTTDTIIETGRVIIRELLPDDREGMFLLDADPVVHKYIGNSPVKTPEESAAVIEFIRKQYAGLGIGRWAMLDKATNDFIGWIGFKLVKEEVNGHVDYYDFGYRLRQPYWNKGYATEASLACLKYGVEVLQFKDINAMTDVDNGASRRVLEKVGFKLIEVFNWTGEPGWRQPGEPVTWYEYDFDL